MDRREMLGLIGTGAVGAFAVGGRAARADEHDHEAHDENEHHLGVMARCARDCARAAAHCLDQLKQGGGSDAEAHANALAHAAACEEFCILSAKQMACKSPLAYLAHQANAEACELCADACDEVEGEIMAQCAASCRECAKLCGQMVEQNAHT